MKQQRDMIRLLPLLQTNTTGVGTHRSIFFDILVVRWGFDIRIGRVFSFAMPKRHLILRNIFLGTGAVLCMHVVVRLVCTLRLLDISCSNTMG